MAAKKIKKVKNNKSLTVVGRGSSAGYSSGLPIMWTRVLVHLLPFRNLGNFIRSTLPVSFGRDTWSCLPGVYARRNKRSHTGGQCVTCHGLHLSIT